MKRRAVRGCEACPFSDRPTGFGLAVPVLRCSAAKTKAGFPRTVGHRFNEKRATSRPSWCPLPVAIVPGSGVCS